ncbi:redox-sensing transcriptional repressor Rex [Rhodopirellula halodulae]|uniref:redox-sensing transcriptional repressor Rex n=1 Tax=Rhodopirellula halodulae TaxID=2894198 RepID=UPI001E42CFD6|nr:redox-sensing transcriptional repressor Rex [Rhodopirellula sp. JC737]MCC9655637.1 redox-sensing transcriptional repressor Rex [Rhodopirellula sp. JC737]
MTSEHESSPSDPSDEAVCKAELSTPAVGRLSLYYRELHRLIAAGEKSTNSRDLGQMVNVSPAVVRRDLSSVGSIGRRGVGYDVQLLAERIGAVLGSGVQWKAVLIGVGSLGNALLRYRGFERLGFSLAAAFDTDPAKYGREVGGTTVRPLDDLEAVLEKAKPELAILAVPSEQASEVAARVMAGGIQGILNFAPTTLRVPAGTAIINVDLASELQQLAFRIQNIRI